MRRLPLILSLAALSFALGACGCSGDADDASQGRASTSEAESAPDGTESASTIGRDTTPTGALSRPRNVVVILTDDQPRRTLAAMPQLQSQLVAKGMTFTNAVVSNPLCCPSRATFLTGRYAHETGVWDNSPRYGGWAHFLPWESRTVAVQLHDAGYTTAFLGKYLNGYGLDSDPPVPPGWDRWFAFVPSSPPNYYDYTLNVDGTLVHRGHQPEDYSTDVLAEEAERFVLATEGPFFLVISTYAPHQPFEPAPRYAERAVTFEPGLAYNEPNMRDKPAWARSLRRVNAADQAVAQTRALLAVDDLVGRVARALAESDELADTAVIYTSDNGLAWGDHRWLWKSAPWEESIGVPFVVRADGLVRRGERVTISSPTRTSHRRSRRSPACRRPRRTGARSCRS